jgi:MoxR-like ATPase
MASQVTTGRFVGRTQELTRLGELLTRATAGEPLVALVGGEAGVGKTRLVEQLAATADGQGVRVLPRRQDGRHPRRSPRPRRREATGDAPRPPGKWT